MSFFGNLFGTKQTAQSSRDVYLQRWTALKTKLNPALSQNIEKWFTDYETLGAAGDALLALPTLTDLQTVTYSGQVNELLKHYQDTIRMSTLDSKEIKAFRDDLMLPMMEELKAKQKQVVEKGPKPQVPAYIPPPPPPETMQQRLDRLKAMGKGGRRKTRSKRQHKKTRSKRQHKKTRKH